MVSKLGLEPEDQDYMFSEDTVNKLVKHGYTNEEFEHPYFDEQKEQLAGFNKFTEATHENVNQEQQVLAYIKDFGSITQAEAITHLEVGRLASRIHNLIHRDKFGIKSTLIQVKNKKGKKCRVARYTLENDSTH